MNRSLRDWIDGARAFLADSIPAWVPRSAALIVVYLAFMLVLTLWMPVWHDLDVNFFQWLAGARSQTLSPDVALVDVQDWDIANIPADRKTVAAFVGSVVAHKQHPQAIILDFTFGPCQSKPCDESWASATAALVRSLRAADTARVNVFATEEVPVDSDDNAMAAPSPHDLQIYASLAGAAHTGFTIVPGSRFLFYRVCYPAGGGLDHDVWSMVSRVLPNFDARQGCDTEHRPLPVGPALPHSAPQLLSISTSAPFPNGVDFGDKFVIVGAMRVDRPQYSDRSGPELIAWALSDALLRQSSMISLQAYEEARPQDGMLLLLVPAFSAVIVLAFTAWYFLLRRLKLRGARPLLPWLSGVAGLATGVAVFAAFEYWMLLSREIQPQVTLILIGMLVASLLCGVRGNQIEAESREDIDASPTEKYDYDVFISYAHDEGAWVFEHVYAPLRDATLPDGRKLSIFFDTSTMRAGTAWQDTISLSIDASRFIIPVYSDIYFQKPYCRFEIKRAHRKWIAAGDQSRCVLPVMRGHPVILQTIDDIQAKSVDDDPDLVQKLIAEITARLAQEAAAVPLRRSG